MAFWLKAETLRRAHSELESYAHEVFSLLGLGRIGFVSEPEHREKP
jgi:hypothetical protein